jgi:hypothetical protein
LPEKVKILVVRMAYGERELSRCVTWLLGAMHTLMNHPQVELVQTTHLDRCPTDMARNEAAQLALKNGYDFLVMIDDDVVPDYRMRLPHKEDHEHPFFPAALNFALAHDSEGHGPCVVAAPYCGPPPNELVYVNVWKNFETGDSNPNFHMKTVDRREAAIKKGFERVGALPTGLILIDCRVFEKLSHPYFAYEYSDETKSRKISTEDSVFSRNLDLVGVPQYCTWGSWCLHRKFKDVGKPELVDVKVIPQSFRDKILADTARKLVEKGIDTGFLWEEFR